jgi:hypothetical protein
VATIVYPVLAWCAVFSGEVAAVATGRKKAFFFEKKNQKTFIIWGSGGVAP